MTLAQATTVLMVGIGGAGMRGLTQLLLDAGKTIIGTDSTLVSLASDPTLRRCTLVPEAEAAAVLTDVSTMIYSDAVPASHPLRRAAERAGIATQMLFAAVGELSEQYTTIAVTGTHGKSSTTAFLGHIMTAAGLDPTVLVGASVPAWGGAHARSGRGPYFIVEADEYREHFLQLHPQHAVITTIDFDHPDYFADLPAVVRSYQRFLAQVDPAGTVVTGEATYQRHQSTLSWPVSTLVVPPPANALPVPLPGTHMQMNAALALALAVRLGVDEQAAATSLASCPGVGRRFETIGTIEGMTVISDYGHHPAELAATLAAAAERFGDKPLLILFEPHTSERLSAFYDEFRDVFAGVPQHTVVLCPVYQARLPTDEPRATTAAPSLAPLSAAIRAAGGSALVLKSYEALLSTLRVQAQHHTHCLAFSAGQLDGHLRTVLNS